MNSGDVLGTIFDPNSPILFSVAFLLSILKWMFLIGFSVYILFAIVVIRQITIMIRTVRTGFELPITFLGYTHLFFAVSLWIFAYLSL